MASISMHASAMNQVIPNEIWFSLQSEDSSTMKVVRASHAPDGRKVDVKPILRIIDNILLRASPAIVEGIYEDKGFPEEDMIGRSDVDAKLKTLASIIKRVSSELFSYNNLALSGTFKSNNVNQTIIPYGATMDCKCSCSGGRDVHTTIMMILDTLSSYSWDAKVVLTVAAFIVNYGHEFLLFTSSEANNSAIAQSIASLKQLRDITDHAKFSKAKIDAIIKLLKVIMAVTRYIVELQNLPLDSITTDESPMSKAIAYIPRAAYWTMLSVVVSASYIASLSGHEESTTELLDLSRLASEGSKIQVILRSYRTIYKEYEDEKSKPAYWDLVKTISSTHSNNMTILKILLLVDGKQHLVGHTNKRIHIEELRKMNVFLLVSGLDLSKEEIDVLGKLYQEAKTKGEIQYEVVWIPVVETIAWDQEKQQRFEQLLALMPWYAVPAPSKIKAEVVKYVKTEWKFEKNMVLVPLDTQGKFGSLNAIDMLLIRGNKALPSIFSENEESLWETQKTWTLELLLGGIDNNFSLVLDWTNQGTMVCLYGGEDIEWIKEFTRATKDAVRNISSATRMELVYVGKKNAIKEVEKINSEIKKENNGEILSRYWSDLTSIWLFWTRLESMLYLKMQQCRNSRNDLIMQELTTLLSYDDSDRGWALFCKGSSEMALARGDVALKSMKKFGVSHSADDQNGLFQALSSDIKESQKKQRCSRIILSGDRQEIPNKKLSSDGCECSMEKCFVYRCCAD
uniref:Sieve element occlusion N-terminal domain-containing protein n=1 Tax=Salix viminalis TaxID=40686 RepID=A0A6N2MVC4_SALVM